MRKQSLAEEFGSTGREPNQMYLQMNHSIIVHMNQTLTREIEVPETKDVKIYLVFFFEAESSCKKTSVICVCFYIWYASGLSLQTEYEKWNN